MTRGGGGEGPPAGLHQQGVHRDGPQRDDAGGRLAAVARTGPARRAGRTRRGGAGDVLHRRVRAGDDGRRRGGGAGAVPAERAVRGRQGARRRPEPLARRPRRGQAAGRRRLCGAGPALPPGPGHRHPVRHPAPGAGRRLHRRRVRGPRPLRGHRAPPAGGRRPDPGVLPGAAPHHADLAHGCRTRRLALWLDRANQMRQVSGWRRQMRQVSVRARRCRAGGRTRRGPRGSSRRPCAPARSSPRAGRRG